MKITIKLITRMIEDYYGQAFSSPYIRKPISWALYQTWKAIDKVEEERTDVRRDFD